MKIKNLSNQKKEIFFLSGASLLALLLIIYLFTTVSHLVGTSTEVFGAVELPENAILKFDFEKYQKVVSSISSSSNLILPADSPAATTTVIDRTAEIR